MRRAIRGALVLLGMSMVLAASPVRADGFWSFDEQWWKDALAKPREAASTEASVATARSEEQKRAKDEKKVATTEAFVPTARISVLKSAYSFLDDYSPN